MQVPRVETRGSHDRHGRISEGTSERRHDVRHRDQLGLEHDHERAGGSPQRRLQGVTGAERDGSADDLVRWALDARVRTGHDQDLRAGRGRGRKCAQGLVGFDAVTADDDHDRYLGRGGLAEARGHRLHGAVEPALALGDVSRSRGLQVVHGAEVDDAPAGGLDASLELVGGAVVPPGAGAGALVGERDDVLGR